MTNEEKVRNAIGDPKKYSEDNYIADGTTKRFRLSHHRVDVSTIKVFVEDTETIDFTSTEEGIITFDTAPNTGNQVFVEYKFSAFTDTEVTDFINTYGGTKMASIKLVESLMADTSRRFDYSTGMEDMKPSQIFGQLKKLRDVLVESSEDIANYGNARTIEMISGYKVDDDMPEYEEPYNPRFTNY